MHSFKKKTMYRSGNIEIFFHIFMCYKVILIDFVKKNDFPNSAHFVWLIAKLVLILAIQNGESVLGNLTKSIQS